MDGYRVAAVICLECSAQLGVGISCMYAQVACVESSGDHNYFVSSAAAGCSVSQHATSGTCNSPMQACYIAVMPSWTQRSVLLGSLLPVPCRFSTFCTAITWKGRWRLPLACMWVARQLQSRRWVAQHATATSTEEATVACTACAVMLSSGS